MTLRRPRNLILLLALLCMAALSLWRAADFRRAVSTRGIGVRTDSVAYVWSARNLAGGVGLGRLDGYGALRPMTHWPPLYPLVLTVPALAGIDPLNSARWLNLLLAAATPLLAGLLVYRLARSALAALAVEAVLVISPAFISTHLFAMSEPLYLLLTVAALWLLFELLAGRRGWVTLALGACLALALLTRYAGLGLALAAGLSVLFLTRGRWTGRLRLALTLAGLTAAPTALWLVRNALVAGTAANRTLSWFPLAAGELNRFAALVNEWIWPFDARLAPDPLKLVFAGAALLLAGAALYLRTRQRNAAPVEPRATQSSALSLPRAALVLLLHLACYSAVVLLSRLAFDPAIPLDEQRIWSPAYLTLVLLGGLGLAWLLRRLSAAPAAVLVPGGLALAWLLGAVLQGYGTQTRLLLDSHRRFGSALEHVDWDESPLLFALRNLPREPITYTNNIEQLYYHTGRHSFLLDAPDPAVFDHIRADLDTRGVLIVLYTPSTTLIETLELAIPTLDLAYHGADGTIFIAD